MFLLKTLGWSQGKKLGEIPTPAITNSSLDLCSAPSRLSLRFDRVNVSGFGLDRACAQTAFGAIT
jgi:hypothetical protein